MNIFQGGNKKLTEFQKFSVVKNQSTNKKQQTTFEITINPSMSNIQEQIAAARKEAETLKDLIAKQKYACDDTTRGFPSFFFFFMSKFISDH
jgi:hypothetical protein